MLLLNCWGFLSRFPLVVPVLRCVGILAALIVVCLAVLLPVRFLTKIPSFIFRADRGIAPGDGDFRNKADIIKETLHLLEACSEPPFDVLMNGNESVPERYLPTVRRLISLIE